MDFQKLTIIYDGADHLIHIVWFVGAVGDNFVQRVFQTVDRIGTVYIGSFFQIILRNIA